MIGSNKPVKTADELKKISEKSYKNNQRKVIRYVRHDIGVFLRKTSLFDFGLRLSKDRVVKLINISSRGAQIVAKAGLSVNQTVELTFCFSDFKEFQVLGKIVYKSKDKDGYYGIQFNDLNNALADHLLKTQRRLKFH